jgi:hypothetical protein
MNALLCGAGHSIRKILRKLRLFCALYRFTLCQLLAFLLPPAMCAPITAPKFNRALHWAIMKIENGVSQVRLINQVLRLGLETAAVKPHRWRYESAARLGAHVSTPQNATCAPAHSGPATHWSD